MKNFIKIQNVRIRYAVIKKYEPSGTVRLNIIYNTGEKKDLEEFTFDTTELRDAIISQLDKLLKNFFNIAGTRLAYSIIKKYFAYSDTKIKVIYNTSRYNVNYETFDLLNKSDRDELITDMDEQL